MKGPVATFDAIMADLADKAANSARRNKPTMWAYYGDMIAQLTAWFADVERTDGGFAGAALALSQKAEHECPSLPPMESARLWAMSVYSRRILAAWGAGRQKVSLDWLKQRADEFCKSA